MRSVHKDEMKYEDALPHVALPSVFLSMLNTFKGEELKARRDENHISCIFDGTRLFKGTESTVVI